MEGRPSERASYQPLGERGLRWRPDLHCMAAGECITRPPAPALPAPLHPRREAQPGRGNPGPPGAARTDVRNGTLSRSALRSPRFLPCAWDRLAAPTARLPAQGPGLGWGGEEAASWRCCWRSVSPTLGSHRPSRGGGGGVGGAHFPSLPGPHGGSRSERLDRGLRSGARSPTDPGETCGQWMGLVPERLPVRGTPGGS